MKIMIFTDNVYMYNSFVQLIVKFGFGEKYKFSYACSPNNKLFDLEENVTELKIKDNVESIINEYDLIISCHSKQIFPSKLVNTVRCINIHPGLNPYNRGWFPQVFSILNKKPLGATIHEMDEEIDHGNIIVQKEVSLTNWDTSLTAYDKVLEAEVELLTDNIENIIENKYQAFPMKEEGNYNSQQDFNDLCKLNMNEISSVSEVIDKLRALTHGEYKNAYFIDNNGNKVMVSVSLEKVE